MAARWLRAAGLLALIGATLGSLLDGIHTHTGTTAYPHPWIWLMAWWVPLLFGAAGVSIGLSRPLWERLLSVNDRAPSLGAACGALAAFAAAYGLSGTLPGGPLVRGGALLTIFAALWWAIDRRPLGLFLAVSTAVIGTSVEMTLVHFGCFAYLAPDFGGVAGWLPALYAVATVAVGGVGRVLVAEPDSQVSS